MATAFGRLVPLHVHEHVGRPGAGRAHIRHVGGSPRTGVALTLGVMWIDICAEPGAPPSGAVRIDGGQWRPFGGWLALLCLLAGAIDAQPPGSPFNHS